MVFFDTCIWIELCGVKSPVTEKQKRQAILSSALLQKTMQSSEKIVTCKEQLVEIISAVQKIKMDECRKTLKDEGKPGLANIKEFRKKDEFVLAKQLCDTVLKDVKHFADIYECAYSVDEILARIDLADINDCIYYDYCKENNIDFYTFDKDIINLGTTGIVHVIC